MKRKTLYFDEAPSKNTGYIELHKSLDYLIGEGIEAHKYLANMEKIECLDNAIISDYQYLTSARCMSIVAKREELLDGDGVPKFEKVHALEYACLCEY